MRIAAIDQGTTSTRVLVAETDEPGTDPVIVHAATHAQRHPQPGWVEHDPAELLANIRHCLDAAGPVDLIGLDNQGESCLAWDGETGEPLSPVIVWQDRRTADETDRLRTEGAEAVTLERAGLPLDPYFSASKLGWILRHVEPARRALAQGRLRLGTTDAWFLDRLAGRFATDPTTASRTSLMNLATGAWDPELCRLFGVPIEALPEIRPTVGDFGGIGRGRITASVVDQQAALYGHGCRAPGAAKVTFGTGAFALAVTGPAIVRAPEQGLLPTVAWQQGGIVTYAVDGGVYDAGAAVEWLRRLGLVEDMAELGTFDGPPAIANGLVFVPALSGLACPHWDRQAGALWLGMTAGTGRADLVRAVLEGVALATADVIAAIDARVQIAGALSIDGGLTRSRYFVQFLADVLGRPVTVPRFDELTAFGCAALAASAAGLDLPQPAGAFAVAPASADGPRWRARFAEATVRARRWHGAGLP